MVRLKVGGDEDSTITLSCFNSTMVRLKVALRFITMQDVLKFQFHNGSIKRMIQAFYRTKIEKFQFHNGSIKGLDKTSNTTSPQCFNSTMVRLKVAMPAEHHR